MYLDQGNLTYLPLRRRVALVSAFAALVRALPERPAAGTRRAVRHYDVPDGLRRDVGLPPIVYSGGHAGPLLPGRPGFF